MTTKPVLIGALGLAALLCACGKDEVSTKPAVVMAPAADRLTVRASVVDDLKPVPATLTTRDMAEARARIPGTISRLLVKEGDVVRQGQTIAIVRDERIGLQTSAYDAQVAAAAAQAAQAEADLARTQDLYDHGVYAKARLDQVQAAAKTASAGLAAARAQARASAELGAQGAVLAPAAGRVLTADVPLGSVVMPGQSIATITAGPPVVRITLPEGEASALKVGGKVRFAAEDLGGAAASGQISQVYPAVTGGQIVADVTAADLPQALVGRKVRAFVSVGQRQAVVIPRRYVVTRFGVDYVRLVDKGGAVADSPVQTSAAADPGMVEVLSGLRLGDVLTPAEAGR
ncbi:efflux RND transporter periplasmic adaptor subunit [Caulobacter segnis]|uniref:Efflux transporter periplasmic adaptor subunit n=1 Tax=Caulobacter segnis TaxID=88688 RepID=A0A2W5V1N7_9CAUL|nr:efflux RND transporter periplasmic adaptor subunit [Caulobacter segnis]PZR33212.1 MAG: efflux transporter periplasmic adaptor subunit [Caulobacter segnis]